ncbi:MAG: hypothetical protein MJZ34_13810 [Paludibacteraceae bacterium]|nr:hypothetical protein [Paludibacteraceae bacterium]
MDKYHHTSKLLQDTERILSCILKDDDNDLYSLDRDIYQLKTDHDKFLHDYFSLPEKEKDDGSLLFNR